MSEKSEEEKKEELEDVRGREEGTGKEPNEK